MSYKIIDKLPINNNTIVSIEGNGNGLKNGIDVVNELGKRFKILSVGMIRMVNAEDIGKITSLMIEGTFEGETISLPA